MGSIHFFTEDVDFSVSSPRKLSKWIRQAIVSENHKLLCLNFIFCSDNYLLSINKAYLDHHDFTDVITFAHSDEDFTVEGDIFISIDRVTENAYDLQSSFKDELYRVMIHGVLHLLGYRDKSEADQKIMREKENSYLSLYSQ